MMQGYAVNEHQRKSSLMEDTPMKHSRIAIALAVALVVPLPALLQAADTPADVSRAPTQTRVQSPAQNQYPARNQATQGYLGVSLHRLPESLRAQLPDTVPREQGILVEQVMKGSPAEEAGLQPYDILLQYNDQKLFSPEQLTRLVASGNSGQAVELTIVRGGRISDIAVTLGERRAPESVPWLSRLERWALPYHGSRHQRHHHFPPAQPAPQANEQVWESFDSLSLAKVNGDQYKAVIGYLATDGTHKSLEFQGTREEIRQQILAQKDLPGTERNQLLDALTSREHYAPFPDWPFQPFEEDFPFAPWWGGYPQF
jgi:hypothetical protein